MYFDVPYLKAAMAFYINSSLKLTKQKPERTNFKKHIAVIFPIQIEFRNSFCSKTFRIDRVIYKEDNCLKQYFSSFDDLLFYERFIRYLVNISYVNYAS